MYGAYVSVIVMYSVKIISKKNYFRDVDIAEKTANTKMMLKMMDKYNVSTIFA